MPISLYSVCTFIAVEVHAAESQRAYWHTASLNS